MKTNQQIEAIIWRRNNTEVQFLVAKRSPERGGFWQPLTGGVEQGETQEAAVRRELFEEFAISSPLSLEPLNFRFSYLMDDGRIISEEVFHAEIDPTTPIQLSHEHAEFRWCNQTEAEALMTWEDNREAIHRTAIDVQNINKPFIRLSAIAAVVQHHDRYLIIQRSATDHFANIWEIPGGSVDEQENFEQAAYREVLEETGLTDVTIQGMINVNSYVLEQEECIKEISHTTFAMTLQSEQPAILSGEHQAFAWIRQSEFPSYTFSRHSRESLMKQFNIQS